MGDVVYPHGVEPILYEKSSTPIADISKGEFLGYVHGRLEAEPCTPPAHLIIVGGPRSEGSGYEVKRVLAACRTIDAATAAGRLLSGKAGREW